MLCKRTAHLLAIAFNGSLRAICKPRAIGFSNSLRLFHGIPTRAENIIRPWSVTVTSSAIDSENKLTIKCSDFAVSVFWWFVGENSPAISSYHKLVLSELKDYDGSGLDLGMCRIATQTDSPKENSHASFHAFLHSGDAGIAGTWHNRIKCYGCIIVTRIGTRWFQVVGTRYGLKSDKASLAPSSVGSLPTPRHICRPGRDWRAFVCGDSRVGARRSCQRVTRSRFLRSASTGSTWVGPGRWGG